MNTAIVLAGGKGSRMNSDIPKQYMQLGGRPLLFYALNTFEKCNIIDNIILVCAQDYTDYCQSEIIDKYNFSKVIRIVSGGAERYDSVYNGLLSVDDENGLIFIHDGARACVTDNIIRKCAQVAEEYKTGVAAVPVKDTIKVSDVDGYAVDTPDRSTLWQIQTPQTFNVCLIKEAYSKMYADNNRGAITDDAMVVEQYTDTKVKLVMADYHNLKVTTPEDIQIAELFIDSI